MAPLAAAVALAGLLAACVGRPEAARRAEAYAAALAAPLDPEDPLAPCAALAAADPAARALRGDCEVDRALRADGDPGRWCPAVHGSPWREECWFQAAEARQRAGDPAGAAELCRRTGPFLDDCAWHLAQEDLARLARRVPAERALARFSEARAAYAAWAPLLGEGTRFRRVFWRRFYGMAFAGRQPIRPSLCEALIPAEAGPEGRPACRLGAAEAFLDRLRARLDRPEARARLCAAAPDLAASLAALGDVEAEDSPLLEAVLAERRAIACDGAPPPPEVSRVAGSPAWRALLANTAPGG